jgi:hypothetical protein
MWASVMTFLESIPSTFWGVVVGAFFTILGVAYSNWRSDVRQRSQFDHEHQIKTKEREMALRKEVYLAAAEAVTTGLNLISRLSNLDLTDEEITKPYADQIKAVHKVYVIGESETVQSFLRFTGELAATSLKLFPRRLELTQEKNQISLLDKQIEDFGKERDSFLQKMIQHNIDLSSDQRKWAVLETNYKYFADQIDESLSRRKELASALFSKRLDFMRDCLREENRVSAVVEPMLSAVRAELELPFDEEAYRLVANENRRREEEAVDAFIKKFMPGE